MPNTDHYLPTPHQIAVACREIRKLYKSKRLKGNGIDCSKFPCRTEPVKILVKGSWSGEAADSQYHGWGLVLTRRKR